MTNLQSFIGRRRATVTSPDAVNLAMIRHWCAALGDRNPAYLEHGVAPRAMLQAWTMPGYPADEARGAVEEFYAALDEMGYESIVATNSEHEYLCDVRVGDVLSATKTIEAISEEKTTKLGRGVFVTVAVEVVDQHGNSVGRQLYRTFKFHGAEVPVDRSFVAAAANASRDYAPIHHDPAAARERGLPDIFTNIITSNGLVGRLVTDWTGPGGVLRSIALRLGVPNHPSDVLVLTGSVTAKTDGEQECDVELGVRGVNRLGEHLTATVLVTLPIES